MINCDPNIEQLTNHDDTLCGHADNEVWGMWLTPKEVEVTGLRISLVSDAYHIAPTTRNAKSKSKVYGSTIGGLFHTIPTSPNDTYQCGTLFQHWCVQILFKHVFKGSDRTTGVLDI